MSAMIGWNNHLSDTALILTSAIAGSGVTTEAFDPLYPAANSFTTDPSKVTRINYVRNATVGGYSRVAWLFGPTGYSAYTRNARLISLLNVRLPAGFTTVTVLTQDHNGNVVHAGQSITAANLVPIPGTTDRYNIHIIGSATALIASISLYVYLPVSTSGYWEVGHVWASDALVFDDGVNGDWKLGVVDASTVERSRGGALLASKLPHRRTLDLTFDSKTYEAAMGTAGTAATLNYRQFLSEVGVSSPCLVLPRTPVSPTAPTTAEAHYLQTMGLYASFRGQQQVGHLGGNYFRATAGFEEIR